MHIHSQILNIRWTYSLVSKTPAIVVMHAFLEPEPLHKLSDLHFSQTTWMPLREPIYLMLVRAEVIALKTRSKGGGV